MSAPAAAHVLLLKGVNVGRGKPVAMADLRSALEGMGFGAVRTVLRSGNAVLAAAGDPGRTAARIEAGLRDDLGLVTRCLVLRGADLREVVAGDPLAGVWVNGSRYQVLFTVDAPDPVRVAAHDPASLDPGGIRVVGRRIHQWCPDGITAAPDVVRFVERNWGVPVTARNWNTVTRLADLAATAGG